MFYQWERFWRALKAWNGLIFCAACMCRQDSRLWGIALLFCSSTYFTRTVHLVFAYLATLIPLVKVYSVIDVYVFFSGVGVSLAAGFCSEGKHRVNVVHKPRWKSWAQILSPVDNTDSRVVYLGFCYVHVEIFMQQFWRGSSVDNQWADKSYHT